MWQFALIIFLISFCIFAGIMIREPRTLWSGVSFFVMMICLAVLALFVLSEHAGWLASHELVIWILNILLILAVLCIIAFPGILVLIFFVEGIKMIRHEGMKPANMLSMLFSILLFAYLAVWPMVRGLERNTWGTRLYTVISFAAVYVLSLMAMYSLSAIVNLVHLKKRRNADYIVVLGAGILGEKVTPLLAARIEKGMELMRCNPGARVIMSGGQGPGEDIPESRAMAAYAAEHGGDANRILMEQESVSTEENLLFSRNMMDKKASKIIIVTTAYHVFRALILARQQGIKCVGFGAKTKWYFTLNALIREFIGYLSLTWKRHAIVIGAAASMLAAFR